MKAIFVIFNKAVPVYSDMASPIPGSEFTKAAENIKMLKTSPTEDELLELYALYKQATVGDCDKREHTI